MHDKDIGSGYQSSLATTRHTSCGH
jgi:hypothetical protein